MTLLLLLRGGEVTEVTEWGFGEVYELSVILNISVEETIELMKVVSASVKRYLTVSGSVMMNRDVSESVVMSKIVSNTYSELEQI